MKTRFTLDWPIWFVVIYVLILLYSVSDVQAKESYRDYTPEQHELMRHAYEVGLPNDLGWTTMAILIRESQIDTFGPVGDHHRPMGKRSYGAMQVTLAAAKEVLHQHCPRLNPGLDTDEEVISHLIMRPKWNIEVGGCYLAALRKETDRLSDAVAAYNMGLGNLLEHGRGYIRSTEEYVDFVLYAVNHGEVHHYVHTYLRVRHE
jgi:hypothetical protein